MNEAQACRKAVYEKLRTTAAVSALVGTRIFRTLAASKNVYPLIVFDQGAVRPTHCVGVDARVTVSISLTVKAISQVDDSQADAVLSAVDDALTGSDLLVTVGGGTWRVLCAGQTGGISYPERPPSEGTVYWHSGAEFDFYVDAG